MDLGIIRRWYPVGSEILVHLQGGRSAKGRLEAIDAESLVLLTEHGPSLLLASVIEQVDAAGPIAPAAPAPAPAPVLEPMPAPAPPVVVEVQEAFSGAWDALEEQFAAEVHPLELSRPVFTRDTSIPVPYAAVAQIDGQLNRVKNRLDSARRLREPARIPSAIRDLAGAADGCGYPPACHLAALLLLEYDSTPAAAHQAETWMERAAHLGGRYAWDLAALQIRAGRNAQAARSLSAALRRKPAEFPDDKLLRTFLALVVSTGDGAPAVSALEAAGRMSSGRRAVATQAGLYLVRRLYPERTRLLEPLLAEAAPTPEDLGRVLAALGPVMAEPPRVTTPVSAKTADARTISAPAPAIVPAAEAVAAAPASAQVSPGKNASLQVLTARNQLSKGYLDKALQIARRGLADHPGHPELLEIVELASREKAPESRAATPPGGAVKSPPPPQTRFSAYARAQYADTKEKDWPKAEQFYRQAIAEGDNVERAVRSLAWGLHRYKRSAEALRLLRDPNVEVKETLPHQNMIITILGGQGHWDEAAVLLEELLKEEHTAQNRTSMLKRLIVAYRKQRDLRSAKDAAQRLLNHGPRNPEFRDIWTELEKAERTGVWDKIDLLLDKSDWNPEQPGSISSILQLHLDNCDYAGVNPLRVQEGTLSEKDVQELEELIRKLGPRRSADRAAYNLTVARILRDLSQTEDGLFRRSLRAFGAAMGDLCSAERRPGDVTRTYYTEAVALGGWDDMGELKVKQFVMSYLPRESQQQELRPAFEKCLEWVLEIDALRKPLLIGLLTLLINGSDQVRKQIVPRTFTVSDIRTILFKEICDYVGHSTPSCTQDVYVEYWQEALGKLRQELDEQRRSLQLPLDRGEPLGALAEDQQLLEQARSLAWTTPLDTDRLKKTATMLGDVRGYLEQSSYLERERLESKIRTAARELVATIEANPTRLSLEYLAPLLIKLDGALAAHFGEVQRAAEPTELEVTQVLSSYVPNATSTIQVQLSVKNPPRRSPAVDVVLRVLENPDDYQADDTQIAVAHSLRDEQIETCTLPLVVTSRAIQEQVLTLRYSLEFTVRSDRRIMTEPATLPLRLNDSHDWEPIRNPYSEGAPVEDEEMFFGRGPLIQVLADSLERTDTKCVVIYGQKRVGKSSVLHHLQQALKPPILAAKFSLLEIATDLSHASLLYKIATAFHTRLEDMEDEGMPSLEIRRPQLSEFAASPQIQFDDYMKAILRGMKRSAAYRDFRMVLLLDEFTVLYSNIERGHLPREFMKSWKAMLESKLFSSVVVGNDLMPQFLKAFPNEFQVARQEPVSYLDEEAAELLITRPIRLGNGESRYRGDSVARVLELTARSPYYIQLFCNRLVQHMNNERQPLFGPADIDNVAAQLVSGDKALPQEQFDNLLTPGDADVSALSDETVLEVLRSVLTGRRRDLHLDARKARELPEGARVIEDLVRRDVIVREAEDRYRIKVGLFAEWIWHRKA